MLRACGTLSFCIHNVTRILKNVKVVVLKSNSIRYRPPIVHRLFCIYDQTKLKIFNLHVY
uniref:Uncharacterized protein n=1 Tax=Anguilla anguilla TaxID=7936 RepID=A0A0E9VUC2_ANGAN